MGLNARQNGEVLKAIAENPELLEFLLQPTEVALSAMPSSSVSDALLALEEALSNG